MVGCYMLANIHVKLQKLKAEPLLPFGGMNMLFMGNFMQFPPVNDIPLYAPNIRPIFAFTKTMQKKIIDKSL
jgi:hypothetical protein